MLNEIMLIDDNMIDVMLNEKVIEDANFSKTVVSQSSGIEALEMLKQRVDKNESFPNLIFLDLMMPKMDGISFLNEYVKLQADKIKYASIVVVSSAPDSGEIQLIKGNPYVVDYLNKPLTAEKLKRLSYKLNG